ncbi:apolipoL family protein [Helicobacter pylori]|uniref:apolipoL family protein n=1 Tax=Helicobacter pylori TaxID=210 RepID=UPI00358DB27D
MIEKMYTHINKDIENKECKEIFENECEQGMKELERTIEGLVKKCEEQFSKDIKEDIEQFEERIKDSLVMLNHININSGFDPNFNIHSGINKLGLFSSIASLVFGIFNFWNPVGLASIGLGAIGIVRSVWGWFSSDYKKSQQRKEVDKNLDKVCGIIEEKMINQIESSKKVICEKVESIKVGLNDPVVRYERMKKQLKKANERLGYISNNIKTRIAQ